MAVDNGDGCVAPSAATIEDGSYTALARPLFIYVNKKSLERPEVKAFVEFYMTDGPDLVREVGYEAEAPETYPGKPGNDQTTLIQPLPGDGGSTEFTLSSSGRRSPGSAKLSPSRRRTTHSGSLATANRRQKDMWGPYAPVVILNENPV